MVAWSHEVIIESFGKVGTLTDRIISERKTFSHFTTFFTVATAPKKVLPDEFLFDNVFSLSAAI